MKSSCLMTIFMSLLLSFAWQTASARHQDEKKSSDSLSGSGGGDDNGDFDDADDDGDDGNELDDPIDRSDDGIEKEGPTVTDGYGKSPDDSDNVTPDETRNSLDTGADQESGSGDDDEDRNGGSGTSMDGPGNKPTTKIQTVTADHGKGPDDVEGTEDFGFPPKGTETNGEVDVSPARIQDSSDEAVAANLQGEVRTREVVVFAVILVVAILVACGVCLILYRRKKCRSQPPTAVSRSRIYKQGNDYKRLPDDSTQQKLSCVVEMNGDCLQTTTRVLKQSLIGKEVC